jgi:predicted kinase
MTQIKPTLTVMCGIQGSGKSTFAIRAVALEQEYDGEYDTVILSSDAIRQRHPDFTNEQVFSTLYKRMNTLLKENKNVILDATNVTHKSRKHLLNQVKADCYKRCIIVNTPIEVCRERVKDRNESDYPHKVPLEVVDKYYKSFQVPFKEEGWDTIRIVNEPTFAASEKYLEDAFIKTVDFNQDTKYHNLTLDGHISKTVEYLLKNAPQDEILIAAADVHDYGKVKTKIYKEGDSNAHYYRHENVGAYDMLCESGCYENNGENKMIYDRVSMLDLVFFINYHMLPYQWDTEKAKEKWKGIFGEDKFNRLMLLHEADSAAH